MEIQFGGSPWWGGIFEQLMKSVKRCVHKIIGHAKFTYDNINTALVKVKAIVNSCPFTSTQFNCKLCMMMVQEPAVQHEHYALAIMAKKCFKKWSACINSER